MRSATRKRIVSLEDGGSGECPLCGIDPTFPPAYVVDFGDGPIGSILEILERGGRPERSREEERTSRESSEPCPRCGRRAVVVDPGDVLGGPAGTGGDTDGY